LTWAASPPAPAPTRVLLSFSRCVATVSEARELKKRYGAERTSVCQVRKGEVLIYSDPTSGECRRRRDSGGSARLVRAHVYGYASRQQRLIQLLGHVVRRGDVVFDDDAELGVTLEMQTRRSGGLHHTCDAAGSERARSQLMRSTEHGRSCFGGTCATGTKEELQGESRRGGTMAMAFS
jgi:hypothetical protein